MEISLELRKSRLIISLQWQLNIIELKTAYYTDQ